MNACEDLCDKILPRNLISLTRRHDQDVPLEENQWWRRHVIDFGLYKPFDPFELYICRKLRGSWKWEALWKIPQNYWNTVQERVMTILKKGVIKYFEEDYKKQPKHSELSPIQIFNAPGTHADKINGTYYPVLELCPGHESPMIYLKKDVNSNNHHYRRRNDKKCLWLYWVPVEDPPPYPDDILGKWWLGNTYFMKRGRARGFARSSLCPTAAKIDDARLSWSVWTGNDVDHASPGSWVGSAPLRIKRLQYNYDGSFKTDPNQEIKDEFENLKIATKGIVDNYHEIAQKMWNYLPLKQRSSLWEKDNTLQVLLDKNKICKCCFAVSKNKVKCIHFDCPGACLECVESYAKSGGGGECIACKREQIVQCPICFEEEKSKYLRIFKCRHFVCLKCFIDAFEKKKAIKKCPCCRKAIYSVDV